VTALVLTFLVVGCVAAPLALFGVWVHGTLIDPDGYVATMSQLARRPAVQKAVSDGLSKAIAGAVKDAGSSFLPEELGGIADEVTGALPVEELTSGFVEEALASSEFADFWAEANRALHPLLIDVIEHTAEGDAEADLVPVDLTAVTGIVVDQLAEAGVELPDPLPETLTTGSVPLMDSALLRDLGGVIVTVDRLRIPLALLAVVALAAGVAVARDRLRTLALAGSGIAVAMAAVEVGLLVGRSSYLGATDGVHIPHAASAAVFDVVTRDLRLWALVLLAAGAALAVAALLVSRRRSRGAV